MEVVGKREGEKNIRDGTCGWSVGRLEIVGNGGLTADPRRCNEPPKFGEILRKGC